MKSTTTAILAILLLFCASCSETIVRYTGGTEELKSLEVTCKVKENIFKTYNHKYYRLDVMSQHIELEKGDTVKIIWGGQEYTIKKTDNKTFNISGANGFFQEAEMETSNGDIYYDRWKLPTTYLSASNTRHKVTYVPNYDFFAFKMPNNTTMLVYNESKEMEDVFAKVVKPNPEKNYFIQNGSFLAGQDENGLTHIMVDNNVNGNFGDSNDLIMHSQKNPNEGAREYDGKGVFYPSSDLYWLKDFEFDNNLTITCKDNTLNYKYHNDEYYGNKELGLLTFKGLKGNETIKINGNYYRIRNNRGKKIEFGKYNILITRNNTLDYETEITIDADNKTKLIEYKPEKAGSITIASFKKWNVMGSVSHNFFVVVANENGYKKTYYNTKDINIPEGNFTVTIITSNGTKSYDINSKAGRDVTIYYYHEDKDAVVEQD